MRQELLQFLRCPRCRGELRLGVHTLRGDRVAEGTLHCVSSDHEFEIRNNIPRFTATYNYAETFGFQWNRFARTQLDSVTGTTITRDRFVASTGWEPNDLRGKRILDVGCGAGRFAEVALSFGARIVAIDYSSAVEACWSNNNRFKEIDVVQANLYELPFAPGSFDYIYCFGVLQHTPDVRAAFLALPEYLCPGGKLAVDVYALTPLNFLSSRHWVRPITRRMSPPALFRAVEAMVPLLLPLSTLLSHVPVVGRKLKSLVPVSNYQGVLPLNSQQLREWAVLDTFDMLSPKYDQPQSARTLTSWFEAAKLQNVHVFRDGHLIGRGRR